MFSGDLNLASPCVTSTGSEGPRSYTSFTTTLLQHHQESDGPPSLVSVPLQDGSSVASTEQRQPVFSSSEATSFADLASKAANGNVSGFGDIGFGSSDNKGLAGAGKSLFSTPADKESETVDNFEHTAEFKPIVKLSSNVTVQSGEENEMVLFSHRAPSFIDLMYLQNSGRRGELVILKYSNTRRQASVEY